MNTKAAVLASLLAAFATNLNAQQSFTVSNAGELFSAVEKARSIPDNDTIRIKMKGGLYMLTRPITLTEADTHPMIFEGESGNKPILCGGKIISGWKKDNRGVWQTTVGEAELYGWHFNQLFVNGRRATLARTPNEGFLRVDTCFDTIVEKGEGRNPLYVSQRIFTDTAAVKDLEGIDGDELKRVSANFYIRWNNRRVPVGAVLPDWGEIIVSDVGQPFWNTIDSSSVFYLENYRGALDAPGEWFLLSDGTLSYIPREDDDILSAEAIVPLTDRLLVIQGANGRPVSGKTFRNIVFSYTKTGTPEQASRSGQAAVGIGAAVEMNYAERVLLDNCEVSHTGNYAISMGRGCHFNRVEHCLLTDLGGGGVKIGLPVRGKEDVSNTTNNTVNNCIITHAGRVYPCAVGILVMQSAYNKITHNTLCDLSYTAISVGWQWGYGPSFAHHNEVAYNDIHHIGWRELSDMGGIYTLGVSPGTRIHHNVIHDVKGRTYGGWGLYTDEGSTGVVMDHNLVYNTGNGGYHHHYGKNNVVTNNIFAFADTHQLHLTRPEAHRSLTFTHNIVLMWHDDALYLPKGPLKVDADYNCYWTLGKEKGLFLGGNFDSYRKQNEPHSIFRDPDFRDARRYDFRLRSLRAARKIGFRPFDIGSAGVYGSEEWRQKAATPQDVIDKWQRMERQNGGRKTTDADM